MLLNCSLKLERGDCYCSCKRATYSNEDYSVGSDKKEAAT
jgi:hypothetical protein